MAGEWIAALTSRILVVVGESSKEEVIFLSSLASLDG